MLFTTPTQFVVLAALLVIGWLFGFASHSGGRKWRARYETEAKANAAQRHDLEAQLRDAQRRAAELESERVKLNERHDRAQAKLAALETRSAPAEPAIAPPVPAPPDPRPIAASAAVPAFPRRPPVPLAAAAGPGRDDLTRLRGVDAALGARLDDLGVRRFEEIEKLSAEDEMALEQRLAVPVGYIARERWRDQAALLRAGRDDEQRERFPVR